MKCSLHLIPGDWMGYNDLPCKCLSSLHKTTVKILFRFLSQYISKVYSQKTTSFYGL